MKNLLIILVLMSAISCTKSINDAGAPFADSDTPVGVYPPNPYDDSLTRNLGNGVVLRVALKPNVVCDPNDSSKPCITFVDIVCTLSKPVNKYIQVEIIKTNVVEKDKNSGAIGSPPETSIMITLAPNTTQLAFGSQIRVSANSIAPDEFRIGKVMVFEKAD